MTVSEIKFVVSQLGGRANKRLGQHFLIDRSALCAIIEAADIHPGDLVFEIGPGLGVLTRELLAQGADIVAVEKDRRFIEYLERNFIGTTRRIVPMNGTVRIIPGDAATIQWQDIVGDRSWKLISNLPYSITSLALRKALWAKRPASKIVVLVQKEVAQRIMSKKTSLLSLMVALTSSSVRIVRRVPSGAFYPPPKVESAVLEIIPSFVSDNIRRWRIEPEKIMVLAKKGFIHPRKLLVSNLCSAVVSAEEKKRCMRILDTHSLSRARAEDVSPEEWAALAREMD